VLAPGGHIAESWMKADGYGRRSDPSPTRPSKLEIDDGSYSARLPTFTHIGCQLVLEMVLFVIQPPITVIWKRVSYSNCEAHSVLGHHTTFLLLAELDTLGLRFRQFSK